MQVVVFAGNHWSPRHRRLLVSTCGARAPPYSRVIQTGVAGQRERHPRSAQPASPQRLHAYTRGSQQSHEPTERSNGDARQVVRLGSVRELRAGDGSGMGCDLYRTREPIPQISVMREDATASVVPDASIEVDHVDVPHAAAQRLGCEILHPLTYEQWGVRGFCVRDPTGKLLNVLSHP